MQYRKFLKGIEADCGEYLQNFLGGLPEREPVQWTVIFSPLLTFGPLPLRLMILVTPSLTVTVSELILDSLTCTNEKSDSQSNGRECTGLELLGYVGLEVIYEQFMFKYEINDSERIAQLVRALARQTRSQRFKLRFSLISFPITLAERMPFFRVDSIFVPFRRPVVS